MTLAGLGIISHEASPQILGTSHRRFGFFSNFGPKSEESEKALNKEFEQILMLIFDEGASSDERIMILAAAIRVA
jgi:hypothetical protein